MAIKLNPYLNFKDNAREAMEFYKSVFGGKLDVSTFKDFHAAVEPSEENMVMHSSLEGENGIAFFASDVPARMEYKPSSGFSMSLTGESEDETVLRGYFEKLSEGGTVPQPLEKAPWGDIFGMFTDKFGVSWLVNIAAPKA